MNAIHDETGPKANDGFRAVSAEESHRVEGGGTVAPSVTVRGPLQDFYMHSIRGSNDRLNGT